MSPELSTPPDPAPRATPPPLPPRPAIVAGTRQELSLSRLMILLCLLTLGLTWLHLFPPGQSGFYLPCVFHRITGLSCPGCGATRAVYSLLHGQVGAAWHQNAMLVLLAPAGILGLGAAAWRWIYGRPMPSLPGQPWSIFVLLAALAIFGIARNVQ